MRILVLGGTGVISRAIVNEGLRKGHEMTVFNRGNRKVDFVGPVAVITGDKKDRPDFCRIMEGREFDAVIDVICYDQEDARHTVEVFKDKAKHIIFTSSGAAYKRPFKSVPVSEDREELTEDPTFLYGFKKANMERYLQTVKEIPVTIIRPSLTFGEGCSNIGVLRQNSNIVDRIRKGKGLVVPGDGTAQWSFTFAPDMGRAYILAACNPNTFGKAYHVCSTELVLWKDLYLTFGRILGIEPKLCYIPTEVLYQADPDLFGHFMFEKKYSHYFTTEKFRKDVPDFRVEFSLEQGLRYIMAWWEKTGFPLDADKDALEDRFCKAYEDFCISVRSAR